MAAYTLLQLFEVAVASLVLGIGVLKGWGPVALLGGGFLIGKAILYVLWPEGGSVYRRSIIASAARSLTEPPGLNHSALA